MSHGRCWLVVTLLSAGVVTLDIVTGPYILFPITFVVPVCLASWFLGRLPGVGIAIGLVAARFVIVLTLERAETPAWAAAVNAAIRLVVLCGLAALTETVGRQKRALAARVSALEGILPICGFCKKIRCADGQWEPVEVYVGSRTEARFSHGFCEACGRRHYPEVFGPGTENGT